MVTDEQLCSALEGTGKEVKAFSVFCVMRGGHLLLALPKNRQAAKKTLALYHPQTLKARVLVFLVSVFVFLGLHRLLPKLELKLREKSPLIDLEKCSERIGFLLGNAQADSRKAIVVHPVDAQRLDCFVVDKIGLGTRAKQSVVEEFKVIQSLPSGYAGTPRVSDYTEEESWALYRSSYIEGRSPKVSDQGAILSLLRDWLNRAELRGLNQTPQWEEMKQSVVERGDECLLERFRAMGDLEVRVGLFHGDFTPWNIKIASKDVVHVLDWEHGCAKGPAGWDWLHYMIQREMLVRGSSALEVLEMCRHWAFSDEGVGFLKDAGWGAHVEEWLGSYLMYSGWILGFDREDLLKLWIANH